VTRRGRGRPRYTLKLLRQHHDAERFVLSVRELREYEWVQLILSVVVPTERVFCATEESAVDLFLKGMAEAMPRGRTYLYGFSR
jgi:hypothetical protein